MSLFFDLVINCDLREDISDEAIEAIRCLTSMEYALPTNPLLLIPGETYGTWPSENYNIWDGFSDYHFLVPDPQREIMCNFQRNHRTTIPTENDREVHRYSLQYIGRWLHDDGFYAHHLPFVYWLASVSYDNYLGYYMETHNVGEKGPHHFIVVNGKLKN